MSPNEFVEKHLSTLDALPERPSRVVLTEYATEQEWAAAPEPIFTFEEYQQIHARLKRELQTRGIEVSFVGLKKPSERKLELTFKVGGWPVKGYGTGSIGWAVLSK